VLELLVILLGAALCALFVSAILRNTTVLRYQRKIFRPGDRVRIYKRAGVKPPRITGHRHEVYSGPGQVGTVLKKIRRDKEMAKAVGKDTWLLLVRSKIVGEDPWVLLVRWDAQQWLECKRGRKVSLRQFNDTIHPDYLELLPK
jgi:hypothetical protein